MTENSDFSELNIFEKDYYADNFIIKNNELRLSNESIFLLHTNIRSIQSNFSELECLIHRLHNKPDFIILTECWITDSITGCSISGYQSLYSCGGNKNGGIAVYSNEKL